MSGADSSTVKVPPEAFWEMLTTLRWIGLTCSAHATLADSIAGTSSTLLQQGAHTAQGLCHGDIRVGGAGHRGVGAFDILCESKSCRCRARQAPECMTSVQNRWPTSRSTAFCPCCLLAHWKMQSTVECSLTALPLKSISQLTMSA